MTSQKKPQSERSAKLPDWSEEVRPSEDIMQLLYAPTGTPQPGPLVPFPLPGVRPPQPETPDRASHIAASQEAASQNTAGHEITSQNVAGHNTASHIIDSHNTASYNAAGRETASPDIASHSAASRIIPSHDTASQITAGHRTASQGMASQQKASRVGASHEPAGHSGQPVNSQLYDGQPQRDQLDVTPAFNWSSVEHSRIPQKVLDEILPTLPPMAQGPYLQLLRLTLGFQRARCQISLERWATRSNQCLSSIKKQASYLEKRGLARKIMVRFAGSERGSYYEPVIPGIFNDEAGSALTDSQLSGGQPQSGRPRRGSMKHDDHDLEIKDLHQTAAMKIYQSLTGKRWNRTDEQAYKRVQHIPVDQLELLMETIKNRAGEPIGSFAYFAKSILAETTGQGNAGRAATKKRLERAIGEIRQIHVGDASYSISDMIYDLKIRCAREGIIWDDDLVNELLGIS